ncbi:MAG: hypothetical protein JSS72_12095 [Armatimonadetes bacterium]|nr:hypothetical protein [Armatimonadota bacterium]
MPRDTNDVPDVQIGVLRLQMPQEQQDSREKVCPSCGEKYAKAEAPIRCSKCGKPMDLAESASSKDQSNFSVK